MFYSFARITARSQIAEALLRQMGGAGFAVFSAGTEGTRMHPLALHVLEEQGISTDGLYSKSLRDFLSARFDVVITVCDQANEHCPIFPGAPERVHWSIPDPAAAIGTQEERLAAFRSARHALTEHVRRFIETQRHTRRKQAQTVTQKE